MECGNCSWSWDLESDDDKPYLYHKCGYEIVLKGNNLIKDVKRFNT